MFRVILLDHSKIEAGELQMMQFGGFDARVKRIKTALEEGKYWWEDVDAATKNDVSSAWVAKAATLKERELQTGDMILDASGKVWMLDHTGWENVKQFVKPLKGEIEMMSKGVDMIPTEGVGNKEEKDRESGQEKTMPGTHANGVSEEVVMLPPADGNAEIAAEEELKPAPKKRGRKPGSKNKPKEKMAAAPARRGRPPAKKASAAEKAPKTAKKAAKKAAAAPAKRKKGVVGVKAQTQVEKAAFAEILRRAKDQGVTAADVVRAILYKALGYKPEQA